MITVKLDYPLKVEGKKEVIEELLFDRIKMKKVKQLPENLLTTGELKPSEFTKVVSLIANIPEEYADEIDVSEVDKISEAISPLLEQSRQTGKT